MAKGLAASVTAAFEIKKGNKKHDLAFERKKKNVALYVIKHCACAAVRTCAQSEQLRSRNPERELTSCSVFSASMNRSATSPFTLQSEVKHTTRPHRERRHSMSGIGMTTEYWVREEE